MAGENIAGCLTLAATTSADQAGRTPVPLQCGKSRAGRSPARRGGASVFVSRAFCRQSKSSKRSSAYSVITRSILVIKPGRRPTRIRAHQAMWGKRYRRAFTAGGIGRPTPMGHPCHGVWPPRPSCRASRSLKACRSTPDVVARFLIRRPAQASSRRRAWRAGHESRCRHSRWPISGYYYRHALPHQSRRRPHIGVSRRHRAGTIHSRRRRGRRSGRPHE